MNFSKTRSQTQPQLNDQQQLQNLQNQYDSLKEQYDALMSDITSKNRNSKVLKKQLKRQKTVDVRLKTDIEKYEEEISELQKELIYSKLSLIEMEKHKGQDQNEEFIQKLEEEIKELRKKQAGEQLNIKKTFLWKRLKKKVHSKMKKTKTLQLQKSITLLLGGIGEDNQFTHFINKLKQNIAKLQEEIQELQWENNKIKQNAQEMEARLEVKGLNPNDEEGWKDISNRITALQQNYEEKLRKNREEWEQDLQEKQHEIKLKLENLMKMFKELEQSNQQYKDKCEQQVNEIFSKQMEIKKLKAKLEESNRQQVENIHRWNEVMNKNKQILQQVAKERIDMDQNILEQSEKVQYLENALQQQDNTLQYQENTLQQQEIILQQKQHEYEQQLALKTWEIEQRNKNQFNLDNEYNQALQIEKVNNQQLLRQSNMLKLNNTDYATQITKLNEIIKKQKSEITRIKKHRDEIKKHKDENLQKQSKLLVYILNNSNETIKYLQKENNNLMDKCQKLGRISAYFLQKSQQFQKNHQQFIEQYSQAKISLTQFFNETNQKQHQEYYQAFKQFYSKIENLKYVQPQRNQKMINQQKQKENQLYKYIKENNKEKKKFKQKSEIQPYQYWINNLNEENKKFEQSFQSSLNLNSKPNALTQCEEIIQNIKNICSKDPYLSESFEKKKSDQNDLQPYKFPN